MRRLFFTISTGVLLAIALTSLLTRVVSFREFKEREQSRPPPLGDVMSSFVTELLSRIPVEERPELLERMSTRWGNRVTWVKAGESAPQRLSNPYREPGFFAPEPGEDLEIPNPMFVVVDLPGDEGQLLIEEPPPGPPPTHPPRRWWITVGIMFAVAMMAGAILAYPMVKRLRRVQLAARGIQEGDLSARADVSSHDAVGVFARRFNRMADKLQELVEGQSQMFQAVAHELRTPIARIRFGLEMMATASTEEEQLRREKQIIEDLDELEKLISEILVLVRFETAGTQLSRTPFDPAETVEEQIHRFKPLHPEKSLLFEQESSLIITVSLNEGSFARVVHNLLSNAARHARSQVIVKIRGDAHELLLEVEDDGPGIPVEERERVRRPFYRLDRSRSRDSGGVGLGLAIVDRIVKAHGGDISIVDASQGGTIVQTRWPAAPQEELAKGSR